MKEGKNIDILSFTDTGQWRLIVSLGADRISAVLKNMVEPSIPATLFFRKEFPSAEGNLLREIETAIYDNPRMLEDFATHIIVTTPYALWVPCEFTDDDEFDPNLYTCVYNAQPEDIFSDFGEQEVCLYSLTPGLNSFLQRTLPGCRISSHLSVLKPVFENREIEKAGADATAESAKTIYINIHGQSADIFAFENGKFLCGATHCWVALSDIAYKAMLIAKTYGLPHEETDLIIISDEDNAEGMTSLLIDLFRNIEFHNLPDLCREMDIPLTAAIAAGEFNIDVQ